MKEKLPDLPLITQPVGGFTRKELCLIGASRGCGKSMLAIALAEQQIAELRKQK